MKKCTPLLVAACLVPLFAGCSKPPAGPAMPLWSSSSTMVFNPSVGMDSLHSSMTIQEIISELGQPTRTNAAGLEFSDHGLFITPARGEVTLFPPFAGHTKEGIGMGSRRADIVRAYGEPPVVTTPKPGFELLRYDARGLRFQLHNGRVDWIDLISKPEP